LYCDVRERERRWPHQVCSSASARRRRNTFFSGFIAGCVTWSSPEVIPARDLSEYICTQSSGNATRLDVRVRCARTRVKSRFLSRSLEFMAGQAGRRSTSGRMVNRAGRRPNFSGNFSFPIHRHICNGRATTAAKLNYADIENDDGCPRLRERNLGGLLEAGLSISNP